MAFDSLKTGIPNPCSLKLGVFLVGDYSHVARIDPFEVLSVLRRLFPFQQTDGQAMIITALMKVGVRFQVARDEVLQFLKSQRGSPNAEVSQRCQEYLALSTLPEPVLFKCVLTNKYDAGSLSPRGISSLFGGDSPRKGIRSPGAENQLLDRFRDSDFGTIYKDSSLLVSASTEYVYDQTAVKLTVTFENLAREVLQLSDFNVNSSPDLECVLGQGPTRVEMGESVSLPLTFVLRRLTDEVPELQVKVRRSVIVFGLPVLFSRWLRRYPMDKQTFRTRWLSIANDALMADIPLPVPQDDVMKALERTLLKEFGIRPLGFETPPGCLVASAQYHCLEGNVGVLLRFVHSPDSGELLLSIRTSLATGLKSFRDRVQTVFLS
jgi:hypothetical protein